MHCKISKFFCHKLINHHGIHHTVIFVLTLEHYSLEETSSKPVTQFNFQESHFTSTSLPYHINLVGCATNERVKNLCLFFIRSTRYAPDVIENMC